MIVNELTPARTMFFAISTPRPPMLSSRTLDLDNFSIP